MSGADLPVAKIDAIRTRDRGAALAFLSHFLDSPEPVNAGLQNLDGAYTVEVSRPTDDEENG
jgi:hypothetical protein